MKAAELELHYSSRRALETDHAQNLQKGRAFVAGPSELSERQPCRLLIFHPAGGEPFELPAEAVWLSQPPNPPGVGVEITGLDDALRERLESFVAGGDVESDDIQGNDVQGDDVADGEASSSRRPVRNLHDSVRELTISERDTRARSGSLPERVALERRYGSSVWEGLLRNPQVTTSEVARMAKSGSLPRALVGSIVANAAWLADAGVQRALLSNPRLGGSQLQRVLRSLPASELQRVAGNPGCPPPVRSAAKRLLGS